MIPESITLLCAQLSKGSWMEEASRQQRDQEMIQRLLAAPAAWCALENEVGVKWPPLVFEVLWVVNHDWNAVRNPGGKSRKASAVTKIKQITGTAKKLERLLNGLHKLVAPIGGMYARNPDAWPDSPVLRSELDALVERCQRFDPEHMANTSHMNAALSARESGRAYLHALVAGLDEIGFPFGENRTPSKALIDLADIAAGAKGTIDYDAFYAVLRPEKKKRRG
jgi:hypothetical protein